MYFIFLLLGCFLFVMAGVSSNPSPFFGSLALAVASILGAGVLAEFENIFVSLVLLLVYLGGMLVVFVYSVAMSFDVYPEGWGNRYVLSYFISLLVYLFCLWLYLGDGWFFNGGLLNEVMLISDVEVSFGGITLLYSFGGICFIILGVSLFLTLFVVLDLVCGWCFGSVRS
uniref:NADH-ubiquinone oxidoreductase chain 6 n=1 Tax=Brookesia decaryi TaxID=587619 RepID=D6RRY0_BRODE|nr:NADH dehydrogenase subunit 6 [Brookesia decaryi]BAJ08071.1 NADH dehydrogenase subunit 6 [Brookesia decaryi]